MDKCPLFPKVHNKCSSVVVFVSSFYIRRQNSPRKTASSSRNIRPSLSRDDAGNTYVVYATVLMVSRGHRQGVLWAGKCKCKHCTDYKAELVVYAALVIGHHKSSGSTFLLSESEEIIINILLTGLSYGLLYRVHLFKL